MYDGRLRELQYISQAVGIPVDYTQGGGGNTSVKLNNKLMAVKASGFKLKQISPKEGYVVINYDNVQKYFKNVDESLDKDYEKESSDFVKKQVVAMEGTAKLRPSVEAGFHSILQKFVIHTHSVYANILCCSQQGYDIVKDIFKNTEYKMVWIPYVNPGFCLTLQIKKEIDAHMKRCGQLPQVFFMQNHGLIITSDASESCLQLHKQVNDKIKEYLDIKEIYPDIKIEKLEDNVFVSKTEYLTNYFKGKEIKKDFFNEIVLYPDQLVYLNDSASINNGEGKLCINTGTGELIYNTNLLEAQTIEETLLAYIYVINEIQKNALTIKTMEAEEIDFIRNWESEAYRKSLVKE